MDHGSVHEGDAAAPPLRFVAGGRPSVDQVDGAHDQMLGAPFRSEADPQGTSHGNPLIVDASTVVPVNEADGEALADGIGHASTSRSWR